LAPRPGLEPGTYGLTVQLSFANYVSLCPILFDFVQI